MYKKVLKNINFCKQTALRIFSSLHILTFCHPENHSKMLPCNVICILSRFYKLGYFVKMVNVIKGSFQLIAAASCVYGVISIYGLSSNIISLIYNALWFILALWSNLAGLASILLYYLGDNDRGYATLQYHYMFGWLAVVIGYPTLVTQFWLSYYPTPFAHVLAGLIVIPMVAWVGQNNAIIIGTTQIVALIATFAHLYICYLAQNTYGLIGAGLMILIIVSLSIPTRFAFAGVSSQEGFTVGCAIASYIFSLAVSHLADKPKTLTSLKPY